METYTEFMQSFQTLDRCLEAAIQKARAFSDQMSFGWSTRPETEPHTSPLIKKSSIRAESNIKENENIAVSFHIWDTQFDKNTFRLNVDSLHNHDFYEINYVYRGGIVNHLLDNTVQQEPDQIVLMNPYAYHSPELLSPDTMLFNIMIRKEFSTEVLSNPAMHNASLTNLFLDTSLGMSPIHPYLIFENTPYITFILHQMIIEYYLNEPYSQQIVCAKLIELWSVLTRQRSEKKLLENKQKNYPETVAKMLDFVCSHCAAVTLVEVAHRFGLSESYLSHYIKKHTGYRFNEIVHHFKMQNAVNYLLHTNYSLNQIVELVGYNDVSYFSKVFKKSFGISPGQYRSQHKM